MKRFLRISKRAPQGAQRGATLTGYGLVMALIVGASISAIGGINEASQTVLTDTADSVGTPRAPFQDVIVAGVPAAPTWTGPIGPGFCQPGIDGCPIGTPINHNRFAQKYKVEMDGIPSTPTAPLFINLLKNNNEPFIILESVVEMNGEYSPPAYGYPSTGNPGITQPGSLICSYLVHTRAFSGAVDYGQTEIKFPGQIIGTAGSKNDLQIDRDDWEGNFENRNESYHMNGSPADEIVITSPDTIIYTSYVNGGVDNVRVFVDCS